MKIWKTVPHRKLLLVITGCLITYPAYTLASTDYFDLSIEQLLETQIVSASKKFEKVADAPAAIYVISQEDIIRSGITNIPDALRMVPGVNVARSDANSWAISIRGFNSTLANKLLVLIDGRSIYNPVFGGVLWEAHMLMLADIDRIEVIRGPGGTLWGANAVNGVINIITKHSSETQGGTLSGLAGEEETELNLRQGGHLTESSTYRVYAKVFNHDPSHNPNGGDAYDEWKGFRTGFRADWDDQLTLEANVYRTEAQQRRQNFSLIAPYSTTENQKLVYEGVNLSGRWVQQLKDGAQLQLQSYIDWSQRDEPFNFIDDRSTLDLEAQYNWATIGTHELITGIGFRLMNDNKTGNNNVAFSPTKRNNQLYNLFAQDKIMLVPETWFLTLGSKFEHNDFSGYEIQPNIRLQWHAESNRTAWGAISRAVRTPTPIEEDLTSTLLTGENLRAAFVPNNHFKSEKLTAYELGYRHQINDKISADIVSFYNDYEYLQTFALQPVELINNGSDPIHFLLPIKFTNDMQGTSHGFEIAVNWIVNENLKIALNQSWLKMSLQALEPNQESAEQLYPEQQTAIKVFWNFSENWTLDTSIIHIDNLPAAIDAYTRMDINLGGQLTPSLRFNLVGQNLLEKNHAEFGSASDLNASEVERAVFGKLTWSF